MADIDINALKPGMVIVKITAQNGPVKIRKSGLVSSQEMVQGLMEMGVQRLEIDPDQTVEIEKASSVDSPMQSLLMSDSGRRASIDNNLSEQFSRSLFLPSIAGLPSAWRYYGQRIVMVLLVISGGTALGWTTATMDKWLPAFDADVTHPVASQQTDEVNQAPPKVIEQKPTSVDKTVTTNNQQPDIVEQRPTDPVDKQPLVQAEPEPVVEPPVNQISPELLQKFNQAVADLGDSVDSSAPQIPPEEQVDVPRVDQMPAWVLTELPEMSFSAHMYASEPQDRWVTLNGVELHQGDWINSHLQLQEITPQKVIMNYKGQQFSMNALTDW